MVLRSSNRISRVPPYLIRPIMLPVRGCHPVSLTFPGHSSHNLGSAGPRSLATTNGVSIDFLSSGYLDVSVPRVCLFNPMYSGQKYLVYPIDDHFVQRTQCQSERIGVPTKGRHGVCVAKQQQQNIRWVSPFRNLWIKAYSRLPIAYRRVSRLSSPLTA